MSSLLNNPSWLSTSKVTAFGFPEKVGRIGILAELFMSMSTAHKKPICISLCLPLGNNALMLLSQYTHYSLAFSLRILSNGRNGLYCRTIQYGLLIMLRIRVWLCGFW